MARIGRRGFATTEVHFRDAGMGAFGSFLGELKRRHVYRVAVAYAAIGWLLVQVVTQVLPVFESPLWVQRLAVLIVLGGFPAALLGAWFYELGPAGPRRDARDDTKGVHGRFRRIDFAIFGLVVLSIALTAVLWRAQTFLPPGHRAAATSIPADEAKSIAVLPFENLSPDRDNAYFADGMQEQILTQLTRLSGLKTISRTSTEKYASHPEDVKTIGQQLGVSHVLEGSVQKAGDEARISLQLIDTNTDGQIWAETYDRNLDNVLAVESEVAGQVANALQVKLLPKEKLALTRAPTRNGYAYQALLRGEAAQQRADVSWKQPDIDAAISAYQEAVAADPQFALAWARLGYAYAWTINFVPSVDTRTMAAKSKQAFGRALALNPNLPEAHVAAGFYHVWAEDDNVAAQEQFKEALALRPQDADAQLALADTEYHLGHLKDANVAYESAVNLDPRNVLALQGLAWFEGERHEYAKADRNLLKALDVNYHAGLTWGMRDVLAYVSTGSGAAQLAMIMAAPSDVRAIPTHLVDHAMALYHSRDYTAALQLFATSRDSEYGKQALCAWRADTEWQLGQHDAALSEYRHCVDLILADPDHESRAYESAQLGWAYVRLGRKQDAEREGQRAVAILPVSKNWQGGADMLTNLARIEAQLGHADKAVPILDALVSTDHGSTISIATVRTDVDLDPIRGTPRFKQLLQRYASVHY
ncbi:MAG TPA: tetratricopeptide repeat protein [Rhodanobacteraceae bacterium]|nr:tetratricopeptide repeat protein [Rhodanobacteraceae bacterium]